jgi:putative endonuclease
MTTEWFVYMLRCGPNGHLYVGRTTDVDRRFGEHRDGRGAAYTRAHPPTAIAWAEGGHDASSSARREAELKRLTRREKVELIGGDDRST